jgi:hypothetical protein
MDSIPEYTTTTDTETLSTTRRIPQVTTMALHTIRGRLIQQPVMAGTTTIVEVWRGRLCRRRRTARLALGTVGSTDCERISVQRLASAIVRCSSDCLHRTGDFVTLEVAPIAIGAGGHRRPFDRASSQIQDIQDLSIMICPNTNSEHPTVLLPSPR